MGVEVKSGAYKVGVEVKSGAYKVGIEVKSGALAGPRGGTWLMNADTQPSTSPRNSEPGGCASYRRAVVSTFYLNRSH